MTGGLVLLGAGGHARVLLATLRVMGLTVTGCVAAAPPDSRWPAEAPWLGDDGALGRLDPGTVRLVNGVGGARPDPLRRRLHDAAREKGFALLAVVHPRAILADGVEVGEGAQILAGAVVQTGAVVGPGAIVNTGAVVDHDASLGTCCHIAPGATLSGDVRVGAGAHVGTGATVIQGIAIGDGALVAAGAVVIRNVPPGGRVAGAPARPFGTGRGG